ncbi:MAG: isochorismatase family protein [Methanomassiliicoccus sp.]|nr:isochorismatase family protein [Methanomassiliicoccus sp.]
MSSADHRSDPARFLLDKEDVQLLVVDVQERLVPAMPERDGTVANIGHLLELARLLDLPVTITEQNPRGLGGTIEAIASAAGEFEPLDKITFSCLDTEAIAARLRSAGRGTIVVVGMEAHICIYQTCLDLIARGCSVHVVRDAVCSRKSVDKETAVDNIRAAGAVVTTTETVIFQLLRCAGTPEFRAMSKRIK